MKHRTCRGYTLIELLAVLGVLSVLAMAVAPLAELTTQRYKEQALRDALWQIRGALDAYKQAVDAGQIARVPGASGYPPNLAVLVDGAPGSQGHRVYFLRRLPRDPFAPVEAPAESTWALRSYASPPDAPRPGADVYDVMSRSERLGSNGVPLKDW
ncbi:MAG: type II secretion system protein [Burkholderiales bacterium]|nr:type II secretion system protein [Burkholderiales bacterium]